MFSPVHRPKTRFLLRQWAKWRCTVTYAGTADLPGFLPLHLLSHPPLIGPVGNDSDDILYLMSGSALIRTLPGVADPDSTV